MEDNQLNFNRPLLSVRRFTSTVASQKDSKRKNGSSLPTISPSSSYKSGPLRNAGTVPFVWEQSPGKPKHETKTKKHTNNLVPKLPPGRISKPKKQESLSPQQSTKLTEFESSKEKKKEPTDSEVPQNVPKKQEKPLEVKKVVNRENERPQITYGPNFLQFTGDDSEEDSDFDYDDHENTSYKVCGLLPHFCLKGSIGLLNPLPGLSVRTRLPISSANKTRPASSSTNSQPARVAVYEHRSLAKQQKDQTTLKHESKEATNQRNSQNLERSGPSDRLQDRMDASNDIDSEKKEVNLQKKGLISFKELLAVENEKEGLQNHMVEKTLYVDTVHKVETAKSCENGEGIFGISHITNEPLLSDLVADSSKQDKEMITETGFCQDPKVDQDLKVSRQSELELPAPPPLPKSPSDSWLWRTLPSVSSKAPSLRSNPKLPSSNSRAKSEKFQFRNPQGQLLPIPET